VLELSEDGIALLCPLLPLTVLFGRYRDLRKSEEKKTNDRHSRILKRHSETLRTSLGSRLEESPAESSFSAGPGLQEAMESSSEELTYPPDTAFLSDLSYSKVPPLPPSIPP
jgi:hypothetical protein